MNEPERRIKKLWENICNIQRNMTMKKEDDINMTDISLSKVEKEEF